MFKLKPQSFIVFAILIGGATQFTAAGDTVCPKRQKEYRDAAIKLIGAASAQGVALYIQSDNDFGNALGEAIARHLRDKLVEAALKDLMPDSPKGVHRGIRRVACMYLDGELSVFGFTAETAKDEFIVALKDEDVKLGYLVEGADFLYEFHKAFNTK